MMIETINIILNKMNSVCKLTQRNFIVELLCSILSIQGKVNFRNLSRFSKYEENFSEIKKPLILQNLINKH
jgi:hypothetical protein